MSKCGRLSFFALSSRIFYIDRKKEEAKKTPFEDNLKEHYTPHGWITR